jgi:acyl-CoA thioesterase-1
MRLFCSFLIVTSVIACTSSSKLSNKNEGILLEDENSIAYLALGDAYTIGEMIAAEQSFPFQLVKKINENSEIKISKPTIIAKTGWRTDDLLESIKEVEEQYDLVSVLIGANNQRQGRDFGQFTVEFKLILEKAISLSQNGAKSIFVFSIPDYSIMPFVGGKDHNKIASEIKQYNSICKDVAQSLNIVFYDNTPISQKAQFDSSLVADDKLHPSGRMYNFWVNDAFKNIIFDQLK